MKKYTLLLALAITFSSALFAQDYIYLRGEQTRIAAKNIRIGDTEIRYEKFDADDGRVFSLKPNQVNLVAFENGGVRLIQRRSKIINAYEFKKNLLAYHLFDLVISNFTMSYERILNSGKIGIQIPVSFGYASGNNFGNDVLISQFYSGIYLNFYPTGQGKVRYLLGPGVRVGVGHENIYDQNGNKVQEDSFYSKLLVNNGVVFSPIQSLSLSAILSLGIRYFPEALSDDNIMRTSAAFSFNLSYRF
jgi:hypothetical protein